MLCFDVPSGGHHQYVHPQRLGYSNVFPVSSSACYYIDPSSHSFCLRSRSWILSLTFLSSLKVSRFNLSVVLQTHLEEYLSRLFADRARHSHHLFLLRQDFPSIVASSIFSTYFLQTNGRRSALLS